MVRFSLFAFLFFGLLILLGNRSPLFSQEPVAFESAFDRAFTKTPSGFHRLMGTASEDQHMDNDLILGQASQTRCYQRTYYSPWRDPAFARLPSGPYGKRYRRPSTMIGKMYEPLREESRLYMKGLPSFYSWDTALNLGIALAAVAPIANTAADENVHNWYQDYVRNRDSDDFASSCKQFGEGGQFIPAYLLVGLTYRYVKVDFGWEQKHFDIAGEWSSRCGRAIFAGFPTLLVGQMVLGSSRPEESGPRSSHWQPLDDNNAISGHAFIGAIPFITAAQMTDRIWLKTLFYAGSTLTGWSRINDDAHFLSQVILGWHLAYLSCRAVTRTENPHFGRHFTFYPVVNSEMSGMGLVYRF